jgi:hypothetical protein
MAGQVLAQKATTTDAANTATTTDATTAESTASDTTATTAVTASLSQTTDTSSSTDNTLPALSTSTTSSSDSLPSLTTTQNPTAAESSATYAIPVISVPPIANAPYMRQSNVPEGTVFIAVGAALGFIGLSVLAWRALVAWSINRSVRRAAMQQTQPEAKTLLRHNKRKSRRHSRHRSHRHHEGTSLSMEKFGPNHRHSHLAPSKGPASQGALFFSPTAGAGAHQTAANRGSTYLPAGYYSAGTATPGAAGHSRNFGISPPGSPALPPNPGTGPDARMSHLGGASSSSLNLNLPPQGRAPSAYLEDLFESHIPAPPGEHNPPR